MFFFYNWPFYHKVFSNQKEYLTNYLKYFSRREKYPHLVFHRASDKTVSDGEYLQETQKKKKEIQIKG